MSHSNFLHLLHSQSFYYFRPLLYSPSFRPALTVLLVPSFPKRLPLPPIFLYLSLSFLSHFLPLNLSLCSPPLSLFCSLPAQASHPLAQTLNGCWQYHWLIVWQPISPETSSLPLEGLWGNLKIILVGVQSFPHSEYGTAFFLCPLSKHNTSQKSPYTWYETMK